MRHSTPHWRALKWLLGTMVLLLGSVPVYQAVQQSQSATAPQIIWSAAPPAAGSTVLFRANFVAPQAVSNVQLTVFADTHYEAWIDGRWLGRGPARFSALRQEYDRLPVPNLAAGNHSIAVLVRYDPNTRRSEDLGGGLQASVIAQAAGASQTLRTTDATWRALPSTAWNGRAAPISNLGLIGRQELLDYRLLAADWQQPGFDDRAWPLAHVRSPQPWAPPQPRSIPLLRETVRVPQLVEEGQFSPGRHIVDFEHPTGSSVAVTQTVIFTATTATSLRIEALDQQPLALDNQPLGAWQNSVNARRPDLNTLAVPISAGPHRLAISVGAAGRSLALGQADVAWATLPPRSQATNPGRRMLLGEPIAQPGSVSVSTGSQGLDLVIAASSSPRYVVLDLGRTVHGRLHASASGPRGAVIDVGWDERLHAGRPLPAPGSLNGQGWQQVDSWIMDGTSRPLATIDARAGRYLLLVVWTLASVRLEGLHVRTESYPVNQVGSFRSSDAELDRIWQVGIDSLVPNMTDAYTDTPWRERGQWWGDALPAFLINQAAFGDTALLRRGLRQMADTLRPDGHLAPFAPAHNDTTRLLDYELIWIELLGRYWQRTADQAFVRELYPTLQRVLATVAAQQNADDLLELPLDTDWSQSALIDWSGWNSRNGQSTALNAQYAAALDWASRLSQAVADPTNAQAYAAARQDVINAINAKLYLSDAEGYSASRLPTRLRPPAPQAQAWALRYDVVPPARRAAVSTALQDQLEPFWLPGGYATVEIYGLLWVLDALAATKQTTPALALIREQYGALLERGATTWWETFTSDQRADSSLSHAWGGAPTWFLSSHVLGGEITGPAAWQIAPHPGDLGFARGTLPFNATPLVIDWQANRCGLTTLRYTAPPATSGWIVLPVPASASISLDNRLLWQNGQGFDPNVSHGPAGLRIEQAPTGAHTITASFACSTTYLSLLTR